jgi:hypothetical protein
MFERERPKRKWADQFCSRKETDDAVFENNMVTLFLTKANNLVTEGVIG